MAEMVRVVKVPVRVDDPSDQVRLLKYAALDELMNEARYLGNMAIRYSIAYGLKGIPKVDPRTGEPAAPDTIIYGILAGEKKYLPSAIIATLARNFAAKLVRTNNRDAWAGKKSLPTYRNPFIPFRHQGSSITESADPGDKQFVICPGGMSSGKWITEDLIASSLAKLIKRKKLPADTSAASFEKCDRSLRLRSTFSWKDKGAAEIVHKIAAGEYTLCDSMIQRSREGDLMCLLIYRAKREHMPLDPAKVCGVDLGVVIPAVCATNTGPERLYIGNGEEVWAARSMFRAQRRRSQRVAGIYSKTRQWERSEKEDRWIHTYYHALTRQIINFCLKQGCGTLHIEDLAALRRDDAESEFRRLMWVPSKIASMLEYKCKDAGITLVMVNPRNSSRRCANCGHTAKENRRSQRDFVCQKCGNPDRPVMADYNAAKNLALAGGDVIVNGYSAMND